MRDPIQRGPASLTGRFLRLCSTLLLLGSLVVGGLTTAQIEAAVIDRTAAFAALYVETYVSHYLDDLDPAEPITPDDMESLDRLFDRDSPLGREIVSFKLWAPDHRVLYSTDPAATGQRFVDNSDLDASFAGRVVSGISDLGQTENAGERRGHSQLLETYAPMRVGQDGGVVAVAEFYQLPDSLDVELNRARTTTWLTVAGSMAVTFLLLAGLVHRASTLIDQQRQSLHNHVREIRTLNRRVHTAVGSAVARDERMLRRISADLHDGPAQELALVLLRLDPLLCAQNLGDGEATIIRGSLDRALSEIRGIAAGLRAPDLAPSTTCEAVERAVQDHLRRVGGTVDLHLDPAVDGAPLPVRIAAFRIVQESLSNTTKHGDGRPPTVTLRNDRGWLWLEIIDQGPGFDALHLPEGDHLGLAGMRGRAQSLGGYFDVDSRPGQGTCIRALLPITPQESLDD